MRIKCVVIKTLAVDFEQLQRLTSAAGLILLSRYFDAKRDRQAAAVKIKVGQMS